MRLKKKEAYTKTFKKSLYEKPVNGPARSFKKEAFERMPLMGAVEGAL